VLFFSRPSGQDARRPKQIRAHVQTGQGEKAADDASATDGRADVARRRGHVGRGQQPPPIRHVGRRRGHARPVPRFHHHVLGVQFAHQTGNSDSPGETPFAVFVLYYYIACLRFGNVREKKLPNTNNDDIIIYSPVGDDRLSVQRTIILYIINHDF